MNAYMIASLRAAIAYLQTFRQGLHLAATRDDGTISREESRAIRRIDKITARYIADLEDLID